MCGSRDGRQCLVSNSLLLLGEAEWTVVGSQASWSSRLQHHKTTWSTLLDACAYYYSAWGDYELATTSQMALREDNYQVKVKSAKGEARRLGKSLYAVLCCAVIAGRWLHHNLQVQWWFSLILLQLNTSLLLFDLDQNFLSFPFCPFELVAFE